jgi:hypothetical protein
MMTDLFEITARHENLPSSHGIDQAGDPSPNGIVWDVNFSVQVRTGYYLSTVMTS